MSRQHIVPLARPVDALLARLALINAARSTIDAQYYQWNSDAIGYLFLSRLIEAADRGVTVRLLVDDMKLRTRSKTIASLCLHPNLDIKVFNPWIRRSGAGMYAFEFLRRFKKLDHRMHNKLAVADGKHAIFGGRNIGADHFGVGDSVNLVDFDVIMTGGSVSDLSAVFESYWASSNAVHGSTLHGTVTSTDLAAARNMIAKELQAGEPILGSSLESESRWSREHTLERIETDDNAIMVISDSPDVTSDTGPTEVIGSLRRLRDSATEDLVIVTPFLVPSDDDIDAYRKAVARGVRIRLLTNSLASNPGTVSNSGFKRSRTALIQAGVELHELDFHAKVKPAWETPPNTGRYLGLHTKLFIVDRKSVVLGSVNLDPRSKFVNTEMGVRVQNPEFAQYASDHAVSLMAPENSWRVEIEPSGGLRWSNDQEVLRRQPARGFGQRMVDWILGLLPIRNYI